MSARWPKTDLFRTNQKLNTLKLYTLALVIFWTAVLFCSLVLDLSNHKNEIQALALNTARIAWEKDLLYRRWNANLRGVYVQVTPEVQPNPYLSHLPNG